MNDKNMELLLQNYKNHLSIMNDSLHDEVYKWDAIRYFQENWDIDEDNFGAMFENAVSLAGNIINSTNHSAEGIIEIAKYEDEAVRSLFRDLFAGDGGDLKTRDEKIQEFIDKSEELRKQYAKDNWRFSQNYRSVLAYLSLYSPDENYLYHQAAVSRLVDAVGNGKEAWNGKSFSLTKYYKFCDEVKVKIEADDKLIKMHDAYLREAADPDHAHHILTFDVIYCLDNYQLYDDIVTIKRTSRSSGKDVDAHLLQVEQLESQITKIKEDEVSLQKEIDKLQQFDLLHVAVTHKKYGAGEIIKQEGNHITVAFLVGEKNFLLPEAFSNKFLATKNQDIIIHYEQLAKKLKEVKNLKNQLVLLEYELEQEC